MIRELIERNRTSRPRIAVIGDVMRDEYVVGHADRFSPEAPAPVLLTERDEPYAVPGGAGNTARQLRHWNAEVKLLGLLDEATVEVLDRHGTDTECSLLLRHGRNPVKRRLYAGGHLLLRHDAEMPDYGEADLGSLRRSLAGQLQTLLRRGLDAVVLSDYGKGLFDLPTLRTVLDACNQAGVPTVVDPKARRPHHYRGCTVFKPNAKYLREQGGSSDFPALVCTRGEQPPVGYHGGPGRDKATDFTCRERYRPVPARSVIGAGDCFAAHLALALAHGLPVAEAAEAAYSAGRAYVQHPHNRPVMPHEVHADLDPAGAKILPAKEVRNVLDARHPHARVVLSNGCFDLTHAGHAATLQWARQQGEVLVAAVNDDASVRRLKGPGRPVIPQWERARMIAGLGCVDFVTVFDDDTPERLISLLRPVVLVKGPEHAGREEQVPGHDQVPVTLAALQTPTVLHASTIIQAIRGRAAPG